MIRNVTPGLEVTPQSKSGNQNTHEKDMDKIFEIATPPKFPIVSIKRSIQELMAMKSAYPDNGDGKELNGITAIIASYKRPKVVVRIFDALLAQTVKPTEIWVSVFSSPHEEEYRKIIQDYKLTHEKDSLPPIHFISGGPQFTYFARFQLALLAKTKYVALFDDDVIPVGKNVFHNMLHTINLPNQEYFGMFGCKGHVSLPQPDPKNFAHAHYTSTFTHEPSKIEEADIVGGLWFVRKEWIKFMFIEDPITIASGEDIHLT